MVVALQILLWKCLAVGGGLGTCGRGWQRVDWYAMREDGGDEAFKQGERQAREQQVWMEVCVLFTLNRFFYPSTSSTPSVRVDSSS